MVSSVPTPAKAKIQNVASRLLAAGILSSSLSQKFRFRIDKYLHASHQEERWAETFLSSVTWKPMINLNQIRTVTAVTAMNTSIANPLNNEPQIDHSTSLAVCNGIGERLRDLMRP
ncbi:MAG TPA: hypothetical protein VGC26_08840, partial [Afipia sp.]